MNRRSGQATLGLLAIASALAMWFAYLSAILVITSINSIYAMQLGYSATAMANAGINDALLQLERNKSFAGTYTVSLDELTAKVTVTQVPALNQVTITSLGTTVNTKSQVYAVANVTNLGQVNLISWMRNTF